MATPPTAPLPARLGAIQEEVLRTPRAVPNLDGLRHEWEEHVARVRQRVPRAHVEAAGEVLYLGELAPGCRTCKAGCWDCLFTTAACNLSCAFCYSPLSVEGDLAGSAFGATPEEIARNHARTRIDGISFSGGDPFLAPQKLLTWVAFFKQRRPEACVWVYTNGLLAEADHLRRLGDLGVDEIRFNLAATRYHHPVVMKNLRAAVGSIPNVTVEIPAIPDDQEIVLSALAGWSEMGVRFLNLHELIYEPGTSSGSMAGEREAMVTPDGHCSVFHPRSRSLTLAAMERVEREQLPLSINDCSMQSKLRQLRGRRRALAPLVREPHERPLDDYAYESCCAYRDDEEHFFHPDAVEEMRLRYPGHALARVARTAPLSLEDRGTWFLFERV